MVKYDIIKDTKYFTLKECREEIQSILNGNKQTIPNYKLIESIGKELGNKKNNLALLCWYDFLLDAIKENDKKEMEKYCKILEFNY